MTARSPIIVRRQSLDSAAASHLIGALNAELAAAYPEPGSTHFRLDTIEVAEGMGGFYVAELDGTPVGCGAIRRIEPVTFEIKRMYVDPKYRGHGVGHAVLGHLERAARRLGGRRLVLETGLRQLAAIALYRRYGFQEIEKFGEYIGGAVNCCYGLDLVD